MIDPIILYYAKGQMTGFPADGDGVVDVVKHTTPFQLVVAI